MAALALSGCMRTTGPVAVAPQSNLDSMAYGQSYAPAPVAAGFQRRRRHNRAPHRLCPRPRAAYAQIPVAASSGPVAYVEPVRYDASYHLDAGDKLRVVVYGQEGLTNTYAIDAGG